jgi:hypothetical protein
VDKHPHVGINISKLRITPTWEWVSQLVCSLS